MELRHDDFCKESKCIHYNLIRRLKSNLNNTQYPTAVRRDIEIARVHCKQDCERTAYQFYQWLKSKGLVQLTSDF